MVTRLFSTDKLTCEYEDNGMNRKQRRHYEKQLAKMMDNQETIHLGEINLERLKTGDKCQ